MQPITTLFFEPLDVLVFRDHRPFMAGQHALARSVHPLPSVFFGALRAALFERAGVRFDGDRKSDPFRSMRDADRALLGDAHRPGLLDLAGPFLAQRPASSALDLLLPWPRDLDIEDLAGEAARQADILAHPFAPSRDRGGLRWRSGALSPIDRPLPRRISDVDLGKPSKKRRLLTLAGACEYVRASASGDPSFRLRSGQDFLLEDSVLIKERRTGVARSRTDAGPEPLVVEESMLYTIETWRLCHGAGYAVEVSLAPDDAALHTPRLRALLGSLDGNCVRLGGKGHLARVSCMDAPLQRRLDLAFAEVTSATRNLKSWCLTPSLFDPEASAPRPTMILGDTLRLGGVNLRASERQGKKIPRGPRPLIGALVPGSVLFFEDASELSASLLAANERGAEYGHHRRAGYGIHRLIPFCPLHPRAAS